MICVACHKRDADTLPKYPALCNNCLNHIGENIVPGTTVICVVNESCSGIVDRLEDEMLMVVRTKENGEVSVPRVELVRVIDNATLERAISPVDLS